jgi:hypothetical protein
MKNTININKYLKNNPSNCNRGAPMGRSSYISENIADQNTPLHLQKLIFVDGDYDKGGAYWGGGYNLGSMYCAFIPNMETMIFVRAKSRDSAKEQVVDFVDHNGGIAVSFFDGMSKSLKKKVLSF